MKFIHVKAKEGGDSFYSIPKQMTLKLYKNHTVKRPQLVLRTVIKQAETKLKPP